MEQMTRQEFSEYCKRYAPNMVESWDPSQFKIICQKCGSDHCIIVDDTIFDIGEAHHGCETCGYGQGVDKEFYGAMIVKCGACGAAMTILEAGDKKI